MEEAGPTAGVILGRVRTAAARRRRLALPRPARRALVAVAVVAALAVPFMVRPAPPRPRPAVATRPRPRPSPPATAPPATTVPAGHPCPPTPAPAPALDVDGDGCGEPLRFEAGVLAVAGTRYELGQAGDVLLTGDWDCDGRDTVGVWRPGTGELFTFAGWAGPGQDLDGQRVATIPGARDARVDDVEGDGCDEGVVIGANGEPVVVRPAAAAATPGAGPPRWPGAARPP